MKKVAFILLGSLLASAFTTGFDKTRSPIPGAYLLVTRSMDNQKTDSLIQGIDQLKIYTPDYYMSAGTKDSGAYFSIGTYAIENNKLTAHELFAASGGDSLTKNVSNLIITKTNQGYTQVTDIKGMVPGNNFKEVETYRHVGNHSTCPIDGAWKQLESYAVKGKDTTWDNGINFKVCYDGYIVWGDYHLNPITKHLTTFIGFSRFEMAGNKGKEVCINSNYFQNKGKIFPMEFEFRNKDEFKQTIPDSASGIRYVEIFRRLKQH